MSILQRFDGAVRETERRRSTGSALAYSTKSRVNNNLAGIVFFFGSFLAMVALVGTVSAYTTPHPTIPVYVAACQRRAALQGYATDIFWLQSSTAVQSAPLVFRRHDRAGGSIFRRQGHGYLFRDQRECEQEYCSKPRNIWREQ